MAALGRKSIEMRKRILMMKMRQEGDRKAQYLICACTAIITDQTETIHGIV